MCKHPSCPHRDPVLAAEVYAKISRTKKAQHLVHTDEWKRQMSLLMTGRTHTEETKRKISASKTNPSQEFRRRQSEAMLRIGHRPSIEASKKGGQVNASRTRGTKRTPHSEEVKRRISEALKGRTSPWKGKKLPQYMLRWGPRNLRPESRQLMREKRLARHLPTRDTAIELKVRGALQEAGLAFVAHKVIEHFTQPDLFLDPNTVVYLDGCYWHSCPNCGYNLKTTAQQARNLQRDAQVRAFFEAHPEYRVLRFWEHEIKTDLPGVVERIKQAS